MKVPKLTCCPKDCLTGTILLLKYKLIKNFCLSQGAIASYVTLEHECMLVQMKLHNLERYIVLYYS